MAGHPKTILLDGNIHYDTKENKSLHYADLPVTLQDKQWDLLKSWEFISSSENGYSFMLLSVEVEQSEEDPKKRKANIKWIPPYVTCSYNDEDPQLYNKKFGLSLTATQDENDNLYYISLVNDEEFPLPLYFYGFTKDKNGNIQRGWWPLGGDCLRATHPLLMKASDTQVYDCKNVQEIEQPDCSTYWYDQVGPIVFYVLYENIAPSSNLLPGDIISDNNTVIGVSNSGYVFIKLYDSTGPYVQNNRIYGGKIQKISSLTLQTLVNESNYSGDANKCGPVAAEQYLNEERQKFLFSAQNGAFVAGFSGNAFAFDTDDCEKIIFQVQGDNVSTAFSTDHFNIRVITKGSNYILLQYIRCEPHGMHKDTEDFFLDPNEHYTGDIIVGESNEWRHHEGPSEDEGWRFLAFKGSWSWECWEAKQHIHNYMTDNSQRNDCKLGFDLSLYNDLYEVLPFHYYGTESGSDDGWHLFPWHNPWYNEVCGNSPFKPDPWPAPPEPNPNDGNDTLGDTYDLCSIFAGLGLGGQALPCCGQQDEKPPIVKDIHAGPLKGGICFDHVLLPTRNKSPQDMFISTFYYPGGDSLHVTAYYENRLFSPRASWISGPPAFNFDTPDCSVLNYNYVHGGATMITENGEAIVVGFSMSYGLTDSINEAPAVCLPLNIKQPYGYWISNFGKQHAAGIKFPAAKPPVINSISVVK